MAHKTLKRQRYYVALTADPETTLEVETTPADQLRAETKGARLGVQIEERLRFTLLTVWCALVRLEHYTGDFHRFVEDVYEWEPVRAEAGGEEPVDPTRSADSTPADSSSPHGSEAAPATGSTPPSTPSS